MKFLEKLHEDGKLNQTIFWLMCFGIFLYFLPFVINGESAYFTIRDNLDGELAYLDVLVESGQAFTFWEQGVIPNFMDGLPRAALRSGLNFTVFLFSILPLHWAYILHNILAHLIGFVGMILLLRRHFIKEENKQWIVYVVAFLFAVIPYYHSQYTFTISGLPLLFYAFLNLRANEGKWTDWLIIGLFPFFSFFVAICPFAGLMLGCLWLYDAIKTKKPNWLFMGGMILWVVVYLFVDWQMIYGMYIQKVFVSHRTSFDRYLIEDFGWTNFWANLSYLWMTKYHVGSFYTLPIFALFLYNWLALGKVRKSVLAMFGIMVASALITLIIDMLMIFWMNELSIINTMTIRFFFTFSFFWILILGVLLKDFYDGWISRKGRMGIAILFVLGFAGIQLFNIIYHNREMAHNYAILVGKHMYQPGYKEFVAEEQFEEIRDYIGLPQSDYRVVNLAIYPSIAQINGFYTLDGYHNNYKLSYKQEWRKVIEKEVNRDGFLQGMYDAWGSKCYLYISEIGDDLTRGKYVNGLNDIKIHDAQLNTDALVNLGADFVISGVEVLNYRELNWKFEKKFDHPESYWEIFLYKLPEE